MTAPDPNALESIRLIVARYVLGLAKSWDIPPVANRSLCDGLYSDSLVELAETVDPTMSVVAPLLERAIVELGIAKPSRADAAWMLADHYIRRIASGAERPETLLSSLRDVSDASQDVLPNEADAGDGLDLGQLIGAYYSYSCPNENYYEPENRLISSEAERRSILDRLAQDEARRWLERRAK